MQLRFSPVAPHARKFRVMIREKGLLGRVEEVSGALTKDGKLIYDPLAQPAILAKDADQEISDAIAILQILDQGGAGPKLFPADEAVRANALRHLILADGALGAAVEIRITMTQPPNDERVGKINRWQQSIEAGLNAAEQLKPSPTQFDVGTIAMVCTLTWLDAALPGLSWKQTHPKLAALQAALEQRPSFQDVRMG